MWRARGVSLLLFVLCLPATEGQIHEHYDGCPSGMHVTASEGNTCVRVSWNPPNEATDRHTGGNPGDCFSEGEHEISYEYDGLWTWHWVSGDECTFTITVTVYYCSNSPPQIPHGTRFCTGQNYRAYGAVCHYTCNTGYILQGASHVQCERPSGGATGGDWNASFPSCEESCSRYRSHCWPGDCSQQLASNCVCRPGFTPVTVEGGERCDLDTPPELTTCQVSVLAADHTETASGYTGTVTDCSHQRDEIINTQPTSLTVRIGAHLDLSVGDPQPYIHDTEVGVVGTRVTVVMVALNGSEIAVTSEYFNTSPECNHNAGSLHPVHRGLSLECGASVDLHVTLTDGDKLCADMESFSGGFYTLQDEHRQVVGSPITFSPVPSSKKRVCFLYDSTAPSHCSDHGGCGSEPLQLSAFVTHDPEIGVHVEGWSDSIPQRGNRSSVAGLRSYRLDVYNVLSVSAPFVIECAARDNFTVEWNATSPTGSYDVTLKLPEDDPRLYAVQLEVHDNAGYHGNVAYARQFVLYDNSATSQYDLNSYCGFNDITDNITATD